jgi:hypothetical protein
MKSLGEGSPTSQNDWSKRKPSSMNNDTMPRIRGMITFVVTMGYFFGCLSVPISHPQSQLGDFYREMGDIFGVTLTPSNRWGGFKALRERWLTYLDSCRQRPILIIDEAQEMGPQVLSELRLMSSAKFDSLPLLGIILAGDARLPERLRSEDLIPLGSRIRCRYVTEYASREELGSFLEHLLTEAGNPGLMTQGLCHTLCDHAAGNYRILTSMAAELLSAGARRNLPQLDEKLYLEVFATPNVTTQRRKR